jgi:threonine aldolase
MNFKTRSLVGNGSNVQLRYDFASDNTAGAAPEALNALIEANRGHCSSYGADELTARAGDILRQMFDADVEVYFVSSGTAANAICLAVICHSFEAVLAHEHSHVVLEETGAPMFFGHGLLLKGISGLGGRIDADALELAIDVSDSPHRQCASAISLSNATEYGTIYSPDHLRRLSAMATSRKLSVHIDGARLANAAAAGFNMKLLKELQVDCLVVGGTKSGMTPTEAIVVFNKALSRRFGARLKQSGQLTSKSRYLAAPWIGMLESGAWITLAGRANMMAKRLAEKMPFEVMHPVETNAVFVKMDRLHHQLLSKFGWIAFRMPDDSVRFMCSWATTEERIDELTTVLRQLK